MEIKEWENFRCELKNQLFLNGKSEKDNLNHHLDFLKEMKEAHSKVLAKIEECNAFANIANGQNRTEEMVKRDVGVFSLAQFMWVYETFYMHCINQLCYLLIKKGHDLFNQFNNKFAVSLEDIENVSTFVKLKFLEAHNFKIMKRESDKEVRNAIAHQNYVLNKNGNIPIDNKIVDISKKAKNWLFFHNHFGKITSFVLKKLIKK